MRCLRLAILFVVLISLTLTLGLGVQKAGAGACKKMGLSNGCVTTKDVRNNTLKAVDLRDEAGADFADGNQTIDLEGTDIVARSITITAPRSGVVIVNASGYFNFDPSGTGRCSITTETTLDFNHLIFAVGSNSSSYPFAATRGFSVSAGSTTFNLVCDEFAGTVQAADTSITGTYVPTRY